MTAFVFAGTTALAVSVEKTLLEYGSFVSDSSRAAASAWQFGQIIPFMMLIQPIMETIRAFLPKIEFKRNRNSASRQGTTQSTDKGQVERMESMPKDVKDVKDSEDGNRTVNEATVATKEIV